MRVSSFLFESNVPGFFKPFAFNCELDKRAFGVAKSLRLVSEAVGDWRELEVAFDKIATSFALFLGSLFETGPGVSSAVASINCWLEGLELDDALLTELDIIVLAVVAEVSSDATGLDGF